VQIPAFLQAGMAEDVHQCLATQVPWSTAVNGDPDRPLEPGSDQEREVLASAQARARDGYQFCYDRYLMAKAMKAGADTGHLLHAMMMFMNDAQFLCFARYLSGDPQLRLVSAQATRYRPGQFLRHHTDRKEDDGRRFAYVINLSRDWQADWGGLLHFTGDDGRIVDTFIPHWNSLSLFKVPTGHFVSQVAPWALNDRLAITGWWHAPA
jgi:Rps23 Pro-64 3,4-dihydroxylase Tpa1-like proline 4-hydroxylase